jgi:hypothetical protein
MLIEKWLNKIKNSRFFSFHRFFVCRIKKRQFEMFFSERLHKNNRLYSNYNLTNYIMILSVTL